LIELLGDRSSDVRLGAVRAAGEIGGRALVPPLLVAYAARETRPAALAALARMPDARAVDAYLDGLASPEFALRERCKAAIRDIRDAALPAVEALVKKAPSDDVVLELQELYEDHAAAKAGPLFHVKVSRKHPGGFVEFAVGHGGDAGAGLKLFGEARAGGAGCAACHTVDGRGGTVGPDLSGVGDKYSRRDLAEAVVYPGKAVREGYQQVIVRTRRGQSYAGPLKAETADELTLQEADGTVRTIAKPDIAARKDTGLSPMPEGLHTGFTEQQFADLVSYLESLRTTPAAAGKDTP
jgi:putative heme-binding domain-containing protein